MLSFTAITITGENKKPEGIFGHFSICELVHALKFKIQVGMATAN